MSRSGIRASAPGSIPGAGAAPGGREAVETAYARAQDAGAPAWISLVPWPTVRGWLDALERRGGPLPLAGVPFAVKDNIDVAGVPTTAACPAYAYTPAAHAPAVARLLAAGAIPIGKTNMDQFATGLTGTRSPYGSCTSVLDGRLVSGGSSSGSAVVVADGTVAFALGTDTAGSGRVPAAFNGIVGVKPSRGRVSTLGVVPACRSLDCVSVFAPDIPGAARVLDVAAGPQPGDPYSRAVAQLPRAGACPVVAVAPVGQVAAVAEPRYAAAYADRVAAVAAAGWTVVDADLAPFLEAARMLYEGPFVAERQAAVGAFIAAHPEAVDPVVAQVIGGAPPAAAADVFAAQHRMAQLRLAADATWRAADALLLPTVPAAYTPADVAADPVGRNAHLGTFTNFANLLDCAAVAVPAGSCADGAPFGLTWFGPSGSDDRLLALAARWGVTRE